MLLLLFFVAASGCRVSWTPAYEAEINSLRMQNEARKKGGDILRMIDILDKQFREYKAAHRHKGILPQGEAETCNDYMQSYWKTLLRTERNLNRKS